MNRIKPFFRGTALEMLKVLLLEASLQEEEYYYEEWEDFPLPEEWD